jgi:hypothetical protein
LRLPTQITSPGPTRKLLAEICTLFAKFVGLAEKPLSIVGRFALCTWLLEAIQLAPALAILGPDVFRGNQLQQLLHCFCRRGLRLSGVNPAGLCSLPSGLGLTFLITQPSIGNSMKRLLDHASQRDEKIPHRGGLVDLFGAQTIQSESIGGGEYRPDRFVRISMIPTGQQISFLGVDEERRITAEFQPKLLGFRCANIGRARNLQFDASSLSNSLRPLARSFAAATPDDPELQREVLDLFAEMDAEIRSGAWTQELSVAAEAILAACFESLGDAIYIGDLAKIAEEIFCRRGELVRVDPGAFGKKLRLLGFIPEPRDAKGFKLQLTEAVRSRAQQLAQDLGAPTPEGGNRNRAPEARGKGPSPDRAGV